MNTNVNFTAYPDVSGADLLTMRFTSDTYEVGNCFMDSETVDTALDPNELYKVLQGESERIQGSRSASGMTIYGKCRETGILYLLQTSMNLIWVYVSGDTPEQTEKWVEKFTDGCPAVHDETDLDRVQVNFWMLANTPVSTARSIEIYHWSDVERNYSSQSRDELAELMGAEAPEVGGKLVLWHGPPGGGKTSAIKALADSWRGWAKTEYITDPEAFFGSAAYMMSVLNRNSSFINDDGEEEEMWRLIVIEDAGQYVKSDADISVGQGFGRLLNITDGLVGQGMKIIVLVTTNQGIKEMHPAVSRPGRCMANIQFDDFSAVEASEWLGHHANKSMTLAEMYEALTKTQIKTEKESVATGQYL